MKISEARKPYAHACSRGWLFRTLAHAFGDYSACAPKLMTSTTKSSPLFIMFVLTLTSVQKRLKKFKFPAAYRFSLKTSVYLAIVLEYLIADLVEVADDAAKDLFKHRIEPRLDTSV
ncbi:hypothetical protein ANCCAN_25234 [Ancylostoma caninum]|uniref:Uncharacterized protein n=1 Tax=Ancylostoma caninum TaxID=29170 RepID=A0A368FDD2_ANCCA|nr:hypothetical protein ANCCAN_25234 [Ancylostoma caninum]